MTSTPAIREMAKRLAKRFERRSQDILLLGGGDRYAEVMAALYAGLAYDLLAELDPPETHTTTPTP